ncbi:TonB-dependent receptor [Prolixibacteraceae bacterium JC049]|nr:TonB-dependent receptor [Prolixibacteraceae bacterium JC049]
MKLTLALFLVCILNSYASVYSQNTLLDVKRSNVTIDQLLVEFDEQSEFQFFYKSNLFEGEAPLEVSEKRIKMDDFLNKYLSPRGYEYQVIDRTVILNKKKAADKTIGKSNGQQDQGIKVKGKVSDSSGAPLPGVTVMVVGSTRGVITDPDGNYDISVNENDKLHISFIGMEPQVIELNGRTTINVVLQEKSEELADVTVVAFGRQKKESVIASIETVDVDELKVSSSNLTTALAGRMAGLISYQRSGEPGQDNAEYFIRGVASFGTGKKDPLILIDNVESDSHDLSRLHPDDLASFSILKDASATALYGARGANGVILVTTKEGREGKAKISVRYESSFSSPTRTIDMADPITYMQMYNEAVATRNPLEQRPFSQSKINHTQLGTNSVVFPAVDWMGLLFKNRTHNYRANVNISGGGRIASYYVAGGFSQDNGILKDDPQNNFENNIDLKKFNLRSNINVNVTKTTKLKFRFNGTFDDYQGPIQGGSTIYKNALKTSPVRFLPTYEPVGEYNPPHVMFGNFGTGASYYNPYAQMVRGYKAASTNKMMAQLELHQDLKFILPGLKLRLLGNTKRNYYYDFSRSYAPNYYYVDELSFNRHTGEYSIGWLNETGENIGKSYLSYKQGKKNTDHSYYGEASLTYNNKFGSHGVSGMLVGTARESISGNEDSIIKSLPSRNLALAGRFTYSYNDKYFGEFNFGYNGSEKFAKNNRWGFFPSGGIGWMVSNENFFKQSGINKVVNKLKIRGTHGLAGNDAIGDERFFYISNIQIGKGGGYTVGSDYNGHGGKGVKINTYENLEIGWEVAHQSNLALEVGLFESLNIHTDLFYERRENILMERKDIPVSMGLWATPRANVGETERKGIDASIDYNTYVNDDLWITFRGNFTYAHGEFKTYEEPDYSVETGSGTPWLSKEGQPLSQKWGYIAERLFIDENDVLNSPRQDFGTYGPGDIKYKDINGDNIINQFDQVPVGKPTSPEINYGFGLSSGYKNFDFSFFFQGSAKSSFFIDPKALAPFIESEDDDTKTRVENGLAQFIADDYWTESNQNPFAKWPRLASPRKQSENNIQRSTMWVRDGGFLRLKNVELGYTLPKSLAQKLNIASCRFYLSGTNLLAFSSFKLWDIEMGGNGLGYPVQRVINLGVNLNF